MGFRKICKDALLIFGAERQIKKCVEELTELCVALLHNECGKDTVDHVAEEIADVEIMLQQMMLLLDCQDQVDKYRARKLESLALKVKSNRSEET